MADERIFKIPTEIAPAFIDKFLGEATIFTMVVIMQGCFGGLGMAQTPKVLAEAAKTPIFRFLFLAAIGYTATSDIETALFGTAIFAAVMHLLRTPEERKEVPNFI
jgi:hypothetical protein